MGPGNQGIGDFQIKGLVSSPRGTTPDDGVKLLFRLRSLPITGMRPGFVAGEVGSIIKGFSVGNSNATLPLDTG